ncbi:hypothetical protein Vretifemale_112 [Volvox reticuliferus]|uniref:PDZ domain-containing protein n=1 Tax=Volvox reticuliferus TaxID=1737510 RepID=A0A8J4BV48_9CHLO|nr:hypothetical protein Vretifemale_112 [Volvox reticuliferus]
MHMIGRPARIPCCNAKLISGPDVRASRLLQFACCPDRNKHKSKTSLLATPVPNPLAEYEDGCSPSFLRIALRTAVAFVCSAAVALSSGPEPGWGWPPGARAEAAEAYSVAAYERAVAGRRDGGGDGPNLALFTEDAQKAMSRLLQYARYVESISAAEQSCGSACTENREMLEKAWQVVASEHYSASGIFSQRVWADTLLEVLKSHNGLLTSKADLQSAISDMLSSLQDPYTEYLPPSAFRRALRRPLPREQSYLRAQYVGLGLELGPVAPGGGRVVLAPLAGSPAEAAGISRGDRLISIDGTPVDQLEVEQLRGLMRGPAGSTATLEWIPAPTANAGAAVAAAAAASVRNIVSTSHSAASGAAANVAAARLSSGPRIVMDVERRDLPQPAIKVSKIPMGPPGFYVTYVRLLYFGSETTEGLEAVLQRHEGAPGNVGYILDLRNNPGGVFEEAIASASMFLRRGDVIAKTIRGPEEVVDTVWQVFAGALRDNGRAALVGERTFGKGLVQYYFPLRDGKDGGVRVTVAKYLTPSGYDISGRGAGLAPDLACADYPHGGLPTGLQQSDRCIRQAAALLADKT